MKRILLKRRASLGDVLNTVPVARRLRKENPDAWIEVSTLHGQAYAGNPYINAAQSRNDGEYDHVIDLNMSFENDRRRHQVDVNMIIAFGDAEGDKTIFLNHDPVMRYFDTVLLHPNISWEQRTIPREWWNDIALALTRAGKQVLVTGTNRDWQLDVGHHLQSIPLAQQVGVIGSVSAFLTGASGLVTVAGATETPVVVLCTMTPWENWFPYRHGEVGWNMWPIRTPLPCYGCDVDEGPSEYYPCRRGDNACVTSFDRDMVVETVLEAIKNDRRA